MPELRIEGVDKLSTLSKALRAAGEDGKGLRKEMMRGIQRATKPIKADIKKVWASDLPQRGGLAAKVAGSKVSTQTRSGGKNAGVRIIAKGLSVSNLRLLESGLVRHPVYGHKERPWATTKVKADLFEATIQQHADSVRKEISDALDAVARQVANLL